ncbi:GNAT family N-acetyltransferase [Chloroflexota bacterium]
MDQDGNDSDALHLIIKKADSVTGTLRIRFLTNQEVKLERMAILKSSRGNGIGREAVFFIEKELKTRGIEMIVLHAQHTATAFYQKCGFKETGSPFLEAGIKHIRMEKHIL